MVVSGRRGESPSAHTIGLTNPYHGGWSSVNKLLYKAAYTTEASLVPPVVVYHKLCTVELIQVTPVFVTTVSFRLIHRKPELDHLPHSGSAVQITVSSDICVIGFLSSDQDSLAVDMPLPVESRLSSIRYNDRDGQVSPQ